nr:unnamed protein product [Digitaria exilis]
MATSGMLTPDASRSEDSEDLMLSTCKISEAWVGGPLFDIEDNFVGMNLFFVKGRTFFLPTSIISECLLHFRMSLRRSKFLTRLENLKAGRFVDVLNEDPFSNLDNMGYPKLVDVPSGEKRIFACSGSFIEWNGCAAILTSASLVSHFVGDKKIAENLRAGIGGPLVDYDGKFIGMNFCGMDLIHINLDDNRTWTPFLSSDVIHDVLAYFKTKRTLAEVGLDGYASGALDWVIDGDVSSVFPSRYFKLLIYR